MLLNELGLAAIEEQAIQLLPTTLAGASPRYLHGFRDEAAVKFNEALRGVHDADLPRRLATELIAGPRDGQTASGHADHEPSTA